MLKDSPRGLTQVQGLIASKFGKKLIYRHLCNADSLESANENFHLQHDDLVIPLMNQETPLGEAIVVEGAKLHQEAHHQISQLVKLILEPSIYGTHLKNQEDLLEQDLLNIHKTPPLLQQHIPLVSSANAEDTQKIRSTSSLIYLKSSSLQRIHKAAVLIHELTQRWAFVPWSEVRQSENINQLGSLTLFCPAIEDLTAEELRFFINYYYQQPLEPRPLFIIGGQSMLTELKDKLQLQGSTFVHDMIPSSLDLDRAPLSEEDLLEVLEMMFLPPY